MTDRDNRRKGDALHPPAFGGIAGECESSDGRDHPTPPLGRPHAVEVDPSAFDVDVRWQQFAEMRAEVEACKRERLKREKWKRLVFGSQFVGGSSLIALLVWAVTKLDARADANAAERQRIREHEQLLINVRQIQDWKIGVDILMGLRRRDDHEPPRQP